MPRKKGYSSKRTNSKKQIDRLLTIILGIVILSYILQKIFKDRILPFLETNIEYIFLGGIILLSVLVFFIFLIIWKYRKQKIAEKIKLQNLPDQVKIIKEKIEGFKPLRPYGKEEPYQIELSGYLKHFFPTLDIEISKNYTRPDIIIEDIAIEIKGPTNFSDLKTIPDKIIRYTKEWDYLIIVLFNVKLHENEEKSNEIYETWKHDIEESFSSKIDKIMFIKI